MAVQEDLDTAFRDGAIFDASDEDLDRFLNHLCSGHVENQMVQHREMNRTHVINTVKMYRYIESIQRTNKKYTLTIVILSIAAITVSLFSIWQSISSNDQADHLINIQEMQLQELKVINTTKKYNEAINRGMVITPKQITEGLPHENGKPK